MMRYRMTRSQYLCGQAMVIIHDQQQGADDCDGDDFPIEVELGAEEGVHAVFSIQ
jgi:hypothetical protein